MSLLVTAYQGRGNALRWTLQIDEVTVNAGVILRAVVHLTDGITTHCIDTNNAGDPITLIDGATVLRIQPGLIPDIQPGTYSGFVTLYDSAAPNGLAWGASPDKKGEFFDQPALNLRISAWPVCS